MDIRINRKPPTMKHLLLFFLFSCSLDSFSQDGPAHARMGFVVIEPGKRPVYLDCRKRALNGSQVGWGFREVKTNRK